jgi:hypothetical protein
MAATTRINLRGGKGDFAICESRRTPEGPTGAGRIGVGHGAALHAPTPRQKECV